MSYRVELKRSAEREIDALPGAVYGRVVAKLRRLAAEPRPTGAIKLHGHKDKFRLRVGDYRVLYTIDDAARVVVIYAVGHRREVYR